MNRFGLIGLILTMISLFGLSYQAEAQHYVPIDGTVSTSVTLPKLGQDSVYLVARSLLVADSGSLFIESGVKIFFGQSAFLRVDGGSLIIDGKSNDSVYLLPYELSHDWNGVQLKNIKSESLSKIEFAEIRGSQVAIVVSNCENVNIKRCGFNNYYAGKGLDLTDCDRFLVDSCLFSQCVTGIELKSQSRDCVGNVFSHNAFDQGQINITISNTSFGWKCRDNYIISNCFQNASTALYFDRKIGVTSENGKNYVLNNVISSGLPSGNIGYSSYGIRAGMDSLIIRNNIFWKNDEAINMLNNCQLVVENNIFYDNKRAVTDLLSNGTTYFCGNVFSEMKSVLASFTSTDNEWHKNNFLNHEGVVLFENNSANSVDLKKNYWHRTAAQEIERCIFDQHDNPELGEIVYDSFLLDCDTTVPISPPAKVKKQYVDGNWRISWEQNPETDLSHYVLYYGDFDFYKFNHHSGPVFDNSYVLPTYLAENVAVVACDRNCDYDASMTEGRSAYAFADYYPYAGEDAALCAPSAGFAVNDASIPYSYNSFVWRTSGTGNFSDPLSLRTTYFPSAEDFESGEVTLTIRVTSGDEVKTSSMKLRLFEHLSVYAGADSYSGVQRPISLDDADAQHYDSICWKSCGDGFFVNPADLHAVYYPGEVEKQNKKVKLALDAWSFCGHVSDTVVYELYEEYALSGTVWRGAMPYPNAQVLAVAIGDENDFVSGFYRTVSDETGAFGFGTLLADTYAVYAFPDTLDLSCGGSYYLNELIWNESDLIKVNGNVHDVDIKLPEIQPAFSSGNGLIGGVFDYPETDFKAGGFYCQPWLRDGVSDDYCVEGLSNVCIALLNSTKERVLGFTITDERGRFSLRNLLFGSYYVLADLPRYGRGLCESVTISPVEPQITDLHLFVNQEGRVAMRRGNQVALDEISVFPNPAVEELTVSGLPKTEEYQLTIVNVLGEILVSESYFSDSFGDILLSVGDLPKGMFVLHLQNESLEKSVRFVK